MIAKPKVGTNINKLETFFVYFQYIKFHNEFKIKFHEKISTYIKSFCCSSN